MLYDDIVKEIKEIQEKLEIYATNKSIDLDYKKTLERLKYLRNRKRMIPKRDRCHGQDDGSDVD